MAFNIYDNIGKKLDIQQLSEKSQKKKKQIDPVNPTWK